MTLGTVGICEKMVNTMKKKVVTLKWNRVNLAANIGVGLILISLTLV